MIYLRDIAKIIFGVAGLALMLVAVIAFTVWLWRVDADLTQILLIFMAGLACSGIFEMIE